MRTRDRLIILASLSVSAGAICWAGTSTSPEPRTKEYPWMSVATWQARHAEDVALAAKGGIDLLFVGDSITEGWDHNAVWRERLAPLNAANFGIGGDTTQNVLWRLQHGAAGDGALKPKAVVLLIGTNNFGLNGDEPAEVTRGITAVVEELRRDFAGAKILVLGIFPRDASPDAPIRAQIRAVNAAIAPLDDGETVFVRDIGRIFLEPDGSILPRIMPDYLHLSEEGYRRWAEAILPIVEPWLGQVAPPEAGEQAGLPVTR